VTPKKLGLPPLQGGKLALNRSAFAAPAPPRYAVIGKTLIALGAAWTLPLIAGAAWAQSACALLTTADVEAILGEAVTVISGDDASADKNSCSYDISASHDEVELKIAGGRADFDNIVRQFPGMTKLSGVGDEAYELISGSPATPEVFAIKGGTFFYIELERGKPNDAERAVAMARKVAQMIR
jgi:hypothetical protein